SIQLAACPVRQIGQPPARRVSGICRGSGRYLLIQCRRYHNYVHRNINRTGQGGDLFGGQPAGVVFAIGQGDDGAAGARTGGQRASSVGNGVKQGGHAERVKVLQDVLHVPQRRTEWRQLPQAFVERIQAHFVFPRLQEQFELSGNVQQGVPAPVQAHAPAEVDEQQQGDRRGLGLEIRDRARLAVVEELKVVLLEVGDWLALPCANDGRHRHALDPRLE